MRPGSNLDARLIHGFFGALCLGCASLLAFAIGLEIRVWHRARAFVPVSAELQQLELEFRRTANPGPLITCVHARYRYAFEGRVYESDRVGTHQESRCETSYARMIHARLHAAQQRGAPVMVWVDPARPEEALLDREPRWGAVAGLFIGVLTFATGGFALVRMAFRGSPLSGWRAH